MKPNRFEKIPKIPRYNLLNLLHSISEPQSALKKRCYFSASLVNRGKFSERSLSLSDHSSGGPDGA
jgi:hypothetical protein